MGERGQGPGPGHGAACVQRGRVLVVDDEPHVRSTIQRLLGREHDVAVAADGREALGMLDAGERYHVILCDLVMPHVSGVQLYAALRQRGQPCADRIVFMTGGAFTDEARRFLAEVACPRIEKPFDIHALRALVRELVDRAAAGP
ncbi:MAG TPA: response regulator [Anaeromyxobacteraceae bacterium]|nr:response regulator [Anaeromyxobacteraceae bacterium]